MIGGVATLVFFLAPLKTLPTDMRAVQADVNGIQRTQAAQAESLKALVEVAQDQKTLRRDTDKIDSRIERHDMELEAARRRLDRIETPLR